MLCTVLTLALSNASAQSPAVNWRNFSWIDHEYKSTVPVDRRHSDYDWWYDHCTAYTNLANKTGHTGYIACGVGKFRCAERLGGSTATPLSYNETTTAYGTYNNGCAIATAPLFSGSYDYSNFENPVSGNLGLGFNQIGKINPDGSTQFLLPMNYEGEYLRVKQLSNNSYLTVGLSKATRKRVEPPQNGTPLYYNPTTASPTNYFINTDIFPSSTTPYLRNHWDVMKFDDNGVCQFNNIYGLYDFSTGTTTVNTPDPSTNYTTLTAKTYTDKQLAYTFSGVANDFVEDAQNNIAVVGTNAIYDKIVTNPYNGQLAHAARPLLIKLDASGKVLGKRLLAQTNPLTATTANWNGVAKSITISSVNNVDYYIVASIIEDWSTAGQNPTSVLIEAIPVSNINAPSVWTRYITGVQANSSYGTSQKNATVWSMLFKNGTINVALIANCNACQYGADNVGDLYYLRLDANNGTISSNTKLTTINAFDLKARITELSNGDFALVSAKKKVDWYTTCAETIPSHIFAQGTPTTTTAPTIAQATNYWNTDAYVARINQSGDKVWETTFDTDHPFSCADYPTSPTSGGGDVKRQECMYGISEAPDGGIVVSGNSSSNVDDNYMAKLYNDCNAQATYATATGQTITTTVNWTTGYNIQGVIKIQAGGTLNITGPNIIQFADSKQTGVPTRIEVYPGGTLNVTNATLTTVNSCAGSMWEGIKMIGAGDNVAQSGTLQPRVMLASATISNARMGVDNGIYDANNVAKGGGWLTVTSTTFLNNYSDIAFLNYTAPLAGGVEPNNKSEIRYCTFRLYALKLKT